MRVWSLSGALVLLACGHATPTPTPALHQPTGDQTVAAGPMDLSAALAALSGARYSVAAPALSHWAQMADSADQRRQADLGLIQLLLETGHRDQALARARQHIVRYAEQSCPARALAAGALRQQGELAEAVELLAFCRPRPDAWGARLLLGEILSEQGHTDQARAVWREVQAAESRGNLEGNDSLALTWLARVAHRLGDLNRAQRLYLRAEAAGVKQVGTLLWHADLYLDAHDTIRASASTEEALRFAPRHPLALVARARVRLEQFLDFEEAERLAHDALSVNPELAEAYAVMANIALREQELATASLHTEAGLRLEPKNLELQSLRAATLFLGDDQTGFEQAAAATLRQSPSYAELFRIVADHAEAQHRYQDAVGLLERALVLAPEDARARAQLAIGMMRSGDEAWGRQELRQAYKDDPFDFLAKNTLDLYANVIDPGTVTFETRHFRIRVPKALRGLLERILPEWLEAAYQDMAERYGTEPAIPIRVELYADRESFGVRTSGLPETYLQGVCFGRTVVALLPIDEPSNLGMTLWHELSHVFHLQLSRHRVPRWFAEGLAEYETRQRRSEWSRERDLAVFEADRDGRLPEAAAMNRSFTRAEVIDDLAAAYVASTWLVEELVARQGFPRIPELLRQFGERVPAAEVLHQWSNMSSAELESLLRRRLSRELVRYQRQYVPIERPGSLSRARRWFARSPLDPRARARLALAQLQVSDEEGAITTLSTAPSTQSNHPDLLWARYQLQSHQGRRAAAAQGLTRLGALGHDGYAVQLALAQSHARTSDTEAERQALIRAHEFDPKQPAPLARLADLARRDGQEQKELEYIEKLAQLDESNPQIHRRRIELLLRTGKKREAMDAAETALYVDALGTETHRLAASAAFLNGNLARAREELQRASLGIGTEEQHRAVLDSLKALGATPRTRPVKP